MQHATETPDQSPVGADRAAQIVLGVLTEHHPTLLTVDEVVLVCAGSAVERSEAEVLVADGLTELMASGLAHRLDRFVLASRAAVRADELS
jgi:hypothetical protein